MKKIIFASIAFFALLAGMAFAPAQSRAAVAPECQGSFLGFPTWYTYLDVEYRQVGDDFACEITGPKVAGENRLDITSTVTRVSLAIVDILLRVAGLVAFGFIVFSGFKFTLSQGDPQKEKEARETAINAIIGMIIAIFAVVIVTFIGRQISQ